MIQTVENEYSMLLSFQYDRSAVNLIDIVRLDEKTYGRMDIICTTYYGSVDYLPLLLDWNNITDVSKMKIGDVIEIPDLSDMLNSVKENNTTLLDESDDIPGIIENTPQSVTKNQNNTTANPTLNITQKDTDVDVENGFIIYH